MIISKLKSRPVLFRFATALSLGVLTLTAFFYPTDTTRAATGADCSSVGGVSFICGATNVEDFAPVPHTRWVIGSDLVAASHPQGYLHVFDTSNNAVKVVHPSEIAIRPDKNAYHDCPGPVDMRTFGPAVLNANELRLHRWW